MNIKNVVNVGGVLLLIGCDPVSLTLGGAALVGGVNSMRNERGIVGAISDTDLEIKVNKALYDSEKDMHDRVELTIKHGMVILGGYMRDEEQLQKAFDVANRLEGPVQVCNEMEIGNFPAFNQVMIDGSITARIKASLKINGNVKSLNYDITTIKGKVIVCGTAESVYERNIVLQETRSTSGVSKVVSYIKLKKNVNTL